MRIPWKASLYQSILKEVNPKYSLERLMLKLKLQYFGHLMQRASSLEKTLMLGKIEGKNNLGVAKLCFWAPKSLQMVTTAMKLKDVCSLEEML